MQENQQANNQDKLISLKPNTPEWADFYYTYAITSQFHQNNAQTNLFNISSDQMKPKL